MVHMSVVNEVGTSNVAHDLMAAVEIGLLLVVGYYVGVGVAAIVAKFVPQVSGFINYVVLALGITGAMMFHSKPGIGKLIAGLSGGAAIFAATKIVDQFIGPTVSNWVMSVSK